MNFQLKNKFSEYKNTELKLLDKFLHFRIFKIWVLNPCFYGVSFIDLYCSFILIFISLHTYKFSTVIITVLNIRYKLIIKIYRLNASSFV